MGRNCCIVNMVVVVNGDGLWDVCGGFVVIGLYVVGVVVVGVVLCGVSYCGKVYCYC